MPVDMSPINSIISTFLQASEQGRSSAEAQKTREQQLKLQDLLFKQQQQLASAEHEHRLSEIAAQQAEQVRQHKANTYLQLLQGLGTGAIPGQTTNLQPQGMSNVPGIESTSREVVNPEQIFNIPGMDPVNIPGSFVKDPEKAAQEAARFTSLVKGAETQAEMPKTEATIQGHLAGIIATQGAENARAAATLTSKEKEGELNRTNALKIAQGHDWARLAAAAKQNSLNKPLTASESAMYGVPVGTTLKDLTGRTLAKPLTASEKARVDSLKSINDLVTSALDLGEKTKWSVFKPVTGGIAAGIANLTGAATPEEDTLRRTVGELKGIVAKERGGTSFTPNEQRLMESYIANLTDNPQRAKLKLIELQKETKNKLMRTVGPAVRPATSNPPPGQTQNKPKYLDVNGNPVY